MAGHHHPRNLIHKNLDLTASREIYMPRKFLGILYDPHTLLGPADYFKKPTMNVRDSCVWFNVVYFL